MTYKRDDLDKRLFLDKRTKEQIRGDYPGGSFLICSYVLLAEKTASLICPFVPMSKINLLSALQLPSYCTATQRLLHCNSVPVALQFGLCCSATQTHLYLARLSIQPKGGV